MTESRKHRPNFLRVVRTEDAPRPIASRDFERPAWQSTLFAKESDALVVFVNCDQVDEAELLSTLDGAHPKYILDVRRVPRFDFGSLNRRLAFARFRSSGAQYIDLTGNASAKNALGRLPEGLRSASSLRGPILLLVDEAYFNETAITEILEELPMTDDRALDILRVPSDLGDKDTTAARRSVFISHANPEDNSFVAWLAHRLTLQGYHVWTDVSRLMAGDRFWDDIERVIRKEAAKVIVVLTRTSQTKQGVLDEIDLAIRVERSASLHRFVVPIRADDLPFSQVRANLGRKNIIDFGSNWAAGLQPILELLAEDRVPRTHIASEAVIDLRAMEQTRRQSLIIDRPEQLVSNWLAISAMPPAVRMYDVRASADKIDSVAKSTERPFFRYHRLVGSFANEQDLALAGSHTSALSIKYSIPYHDFIEGTSTDLPGLKSRDARNLAANILRQGWAAQMRKAGLLPFEMASGATAWYVPKGLIDGDKFQFIADDGKRRRKSLVGWSERRKVHWHFAVEARPVVSSDPRFILRQHVIFTGDGKTPLVSKDRMHVLRRSFCKSWWNDRWRDLLVAFVSWLSSGGNNKLALGTNEFAVLDDKLLRFTSPVSFVDQVTDELFDDDELDELSIDDDEGDVVWQDELPQIEDAGE